MPDLTRETLAELREMNEAVAAKYLRYLAALATSQTANVARGDWEEAREDMEAALYLHRDSLLLAAERGLGAEGGR